MKESPAQTDAASSLSDLFGGTKAASFFRQMRASRSAACVSLMFLSLGTGFFSLLLAPSLYGLPLFREYWKSPLIISLNLLPSVLLVFLLFFLTGRAWAAFVFPSAAVLLASFADFIKIQIRGEPFMAGDLLYAGEALDIFGAYSVQWNWKLTAAIFFFGIGAVWCALVHRVKISSARTRVAGTAAAAVLSGAAYAGLYANESVYEYAVPPIDAVRNTQNEAFIYRGFVYPFLHSIKLALPVPPPDYERAGEILASYAYDDIPDGKRVNVVSVMLEAFSDLSVFDGITFTEDIYAPWHALQKESVSGNLLVNVFAGGTVNTERLFLTGFSTLPEIRGNISSYVRYLREQGYYTEGYHAGDDWYYDRSRVHNYLGFDNYYFLQSFEDADRTDESFFSKVRSLYEAHDKTVPYFSHNLSYQNHGAYYEEENYGTGIIEQGGLSDAAYNILSNYLVGIKDTNSRIAAFIDSFREEDEPVVVLLYGDHMPWLGNQDSVYGEMGIDVFSGAPEAVYNRYSVPYVIWSNDAAKKVLGNDFVGDGGELSPVFLMNKLFELCSWGGNEYMKSASAVMRAVPVVHTPTGLFIENGNAVSVLTLVNGAVYNDFLITEYYTKKLKLPSEESKKIRKMEEEDGRYSIA